MISYTAKQVTFYRGYNPQNLANKWKISPFLGIPKQPQYLTITHFIAKKKQQESPAAFLTTKPQEICVIFALQRIQKR